MKPRLVLITALLLPPLGAPQGEAERDGWTYRREFEHASVFVDLETKTGQIALE